MSKICSHDKLPCPARREGKGPGESQCEQNGVCQRVDMNALPRLFISPPSRVDALLASWPSTMDTQGDADKMQAMVSLARSLQADVTTAEKRIGELEGRLEEWECESHRWGESEPITDPAKVRALTESRLSALQSVVEQKDGALREVDGCFQAAYVEGLADAIAEQPHHAGSLADLVTRRLLPAHDASVQALQLSPDAAGEQADTTRDAVIEEVAAERRRQIEREGWTPKHDDGHTDGCMAVAAVCYVLHASAQQPTHPTSWRTAYLRYARSLWPWGDGWKPKDPRRDLIRAIALLVAEVERRDRALKSTHPDQSPAKHGEA